MNPATTEATARRLAAAVIATLALTLGACTGYGPGDVRSGQSADEVARSMGAPTARYPLAGGGTRLEFARGPYGKHTYMVDTDAAGRVTGWQQVLDEKAFNALPVGTPADEVLRTIGTPSERFAIPRQRLDIWNYRYETPFCIWFQVSVDQQDRRVRETGYGPDPHCPENRPEFGFVPF